MKVGVLGGGQLGRMLALAGCPLGFTFRFFDPSAEISAGSLGEQITAGYDNLEALERFASGLDLATYEFENVPVDTARVLQEKVPVYPAPEALEMAQDRGNEKKRFVELEIPTTEYELVDNLSELEQALQKIGCPAVLKHRRLGYDGKGQEVIRAAQNAADAWSRLQERPAILERFVPFRREASILAVQDRSRSVAFYPLVENHHRDGILRLTLAPAPELRPELQKQAEEYAYRVLKSLDYTGVLAMEFFEYEGQLLANEMACRVHNSGHWTIEGAETSQFENHLRAISGLPLGSVTPRGHSAMANLIGSLPQAHQILAIPGAHLHLYNKAPYSRRKLGHVTLLDTSLQDLAIRLEQLLRQIECVSPGSGREPKGEPKS
ncbi:MAG: 5-(carboxyamino)imidazole ribonucleotide synthase [Acidobacteriota bacterium]